MQVESAAALHIMSHAVVGFPSLKENLKAIDCLAGAGVRIIELQVPFSDPVADGPTLVNACHQGLINGGSVTTTLELARKASENHPDVIFVLMSYLNPVFKYGMKRCFDDAVSAGIQGLIIPDWPVESVERYLPQLDSLGLAPILMVTPNTPTERLRRICRACRLMLYVVARSGVTGKQTPWNEDFYRYLDRIRAQTRLPLAVGFGVRGADDLAALDGKVEIAAVCSRYIEWQAELGSDRAAMKMAELISSQI